MRKTGIGITLLCLCLTLTACGKDGPEHNLAEKIKKESGVKVSQPLDNGVIQKDVPVRPYTGQMKTVECNPLVLNDISAEETQAAVSYQTVYGLASASLQDKINARSKSLALALAQDADAESYVSVYVSFCYNDVLSFVGVRNSASVYTGPANAGSAGEEVPAKVETLNFDLRTGEPLTIADLFDPEVQALPEDVAKASKFYLSEYGLHLVAEDGTTSCCSFGQFADSWRIADGCDPSLYLHPDQIGPALLYAGSADLTEDASWDDFGCDNAYISYSIQAPDDFPEELLSRAHEIVTEALPPKDTVVAMAHAHRGTWISSSCDVSCEHLGDYYTINILRNYNTNEDLSWVFENRCEVYDQELTPLDFADVFDPGFDTESLLRDGLRNVWMGSYGQNPNYRLPDGSSGELSDEILTEMIDGGSFLLKNRSLFFYSRTVFLTDMTLDPENPNIYATPLTLEINYSEIGEDQLKIL